MEKFTTKNGTTLYYEIAYCKGGYNMFTGTEAPRCYELDIQRRENEFMSFSTLNDDCGLDRVLIKRVGRQSKKAREKLEQQATEFLTAYLNKKYPNL